MPAPLTVFTGLVVPMDRADVDTDAMIPKQYLKSSKSTGFGANLFDSWRYLDPGDIDTDPARRRLNPSFVLNQPRYQGASIMLARGGFGCGSSREQAVWAMRDYGIRAYLAPGYSEIFYNNSLKCGLLPVVLPEAQIDELFPLVESVPGFKLTVDLVEQRIVLANGKAFSFSIDGFRRRCLIEGLDETTYALAHAERIRAYEKERARTTPWLTLQYKQGEA